MIAGSLFSPRREVTQVVAFAAQVEAGFSGRVSVRESASHGISTIWPATYYEGHQPSSRLYKVIMEQRSFRKLIDTSRRPVAQLIIETVVDQIFGSQRRAQ